MTIDRKLIEELIKQLNEAENRRPNISVEETIAGIDAIMAEDVEGWSNGVHPLTAKPNARPSECCSNRLLTIIGTSSRSSSIHLSPHSLGE